MSPQERTHKIAKREAAEEALLTDIAVVGLDESGLTFAIRAATVGIQVRAYDLDDVRIAQLESREASFLSESETDRFKRASSLVLTSRADDLKRLDAYVIAGDIDDLPELVARVGKNLSPNSLVVLETRVSPGECDQTVIPLLEKQSGLSRHEFLFAYAPEPLTDKTRRVIGAMNRESAMRAYELYRTVLDVEIMQLRSVKEAEAVVLYEDALSDVSRALILELAQVFERSDVDMEKVLIGASIDTTLFKEWPGLMQNRTVADSYRLARGGLDKGSEYRLLSAAQRTLSGMPFYISRILTETLRQKRIALRALPVAILGLGVPLQTGSEAPVRSLIDALKKKGAKVRLYDPHYPLQSDARSLTEALSGVKAVVIAQPHAEFCALSAEMLENFGVSVVVDAAMCLDKAQFNASRILYRGVGR